MAVRAGGATDPASRIKHLIRRHDERFRAVFLQATELIRDNSTLDELADLLQAGRLEDALDGIEAAGRLLGDAYGDALVASAKDTPSFLSNALTVTVSFDQTNVRAVDAIQGNRLRLIREFTVDQRQALRNAMARGIAEGLNPRDQARLFRDTVGLTARQEEAVARYKSLLKSAGTDNDLASDALQRKLRDKRFDGTVRRAIREGKPLTNEQIDRMVGRYRERYINYRSEVIGRTEALRSAHQGSEEMYRQAIENGDLDEKLVIRTWVTAKDERVRGSHSTLNGEQRGIGETWNGLRFPGDPDGPAKETIQCRCVLTTRLAESPAQQ